MASLTNSGSSLLSGRADVTAAGTPEPISASNSRIVSVAIQAESDNTGRIVVGDSDIVETEGDTAQGIILAAGDTITLNVSQLSAVHIDSEVSGDGVTFVAVRA